MYDGTAWDRQRLRLRNHRRSNKTVVDENPQEGSNRAQEEYSVDDSNSFRETVESVYAQLHHDLDSPEAESTDYSNDRIHPDASNERCQSHTYRLFDGNTYKSNDGWNLLNEWI